MGELAIHADAVLGDSLKGLRQGRAEPAAQSAARSCYSGSSGPCVWFGSISCHRLPLRDGINKKPGGRPTAHFSTVFPLEKTRMVIDGAAERRLQAIHRDRCTWWRAMVPPWCIHSLVRSLVCRVDRRPAAASDLHRWLGARCELPHEDDCVSSAGSGAQQTTC